MTAPSREFPTVDKGTARESRRCRGNRGRRQDGLSEPQQRRPGHRSLPDGGRATRDSDLPHDPEAVAKQLAYSEVTGSYLMTEVVKAFEDEFHTAVSKPVVMGLLRPANVPATGKLAA